ncbi:MAG: translation initiation factor IF-2 [bacterium]|nr:translation initiation factor IF-2 [bacterium]
MNLSSLSQQLNLSIPELRARIKEAGFHVSQKAQKIDNKLAREIVHKLTGKISVQARDEKPTKIQVGKFISVKEFADKLHEPVTVVIKKLLDNGVMATINEEIDLDTASIIASELGVEVEMVAGEGTKLGVGYVADVLAQEEKIKLLPRAPIVAVMGHVDHGKTTLLDTIRKTNVVAQEAGAITQHIGAYQIEHGGKFITFLDTPGHEAFAAMRARGANVTDIIVLVVAADDSVKPQTVEVINRAKLTKTPLVVAINKIDKPGADPNRVKADLASLGVTVEDFGGHVPSVDISAKTAKNLDKLLEIILLSAEVETLQANPEGQTVGTVIDSRLSKGQGAVATVLVQNGTLKPGDIVVVGSTYGKIRSMEDAYGKKLKLAVPSTPTQISGLSDVPQAGDILRVMKTPEEAKIEAVALQKMERARRLQVRPAIKADPNQRELKVILRADVQGSLEALLEALNKLSSEDVKLNIVNQGVGEVTESDITMAENTKSVILGFHVRSAPAAVKLAKLKNVTIDIYQIIYELLEDVTAALLAMMPVEVKVISLGRAKIKAVFRTEKDFMIIGGEVIEGKIVEKKKFKIIRDKAQVGQGKIDELQQNKVEVSEVTAAKEFGARAINLTSPIENSDILELFDEVVKKKEMK